jgi:hypothetical protein
MARRTRHTIFSALGAASVVALGAMWVRSADHYHGVFVQFGARSPGDDARMAEVNLSHGVVHLLVMRNPWAKVGATRWQIDAKPDGPAQFRWQLSAIPTPGGFEVSFPIPLLMVLVGAATGRSVWRYRVASRNPGRCAICGYDLTGLPTGHACPECGSHVARPHWLTDIAST